MTWTALLSLAALLSSATGCMSAETSEASQLTRLEHGIDVSTTAPDRFTSRGEVPGDDTPGPVLPRAEPTVAPPAMTPNDPGPTPEETTDDTSPRPTIRVWGSPSGGHGAPGFVPVSKIVEGAAPPDAPGPAK